MCLAQGHNTVPLVGTDPRTSRFGVHTLPLRHNFDNEGFRKISFVRLPKKFSKSKVPGTEMKFSAVKNKFLLYSDM